MGGGEESVIPLDVTNYAWGRRAMNPNQPFIQNVDNSRSTHRMAADVDAHGNWWAYPTIVEEKGKLKRFEDNEEALRWNIQHGEAVPFGSDRSSAINFASGAYKQGTALQGSILERLGF